MTTYSFDLSRFEEGALVATRHPDNRAVEGDWICSASSDDEALRKAHEAAFHEWCAPESRDCSDFEVEFIDA